MTDVSCILYYVLLALPTLYVIVRALTSGAIGKLKWAFIFSGFMLFCWECTRIVFHGTGDPGLVLYLYDLDLPFVALGALGFFVFVIRFYSLDKLVTPSGLAVLWIIPLCTAILALTVPAHSFIREGLALLSLRPLHRVAGRRAYWFWVHAFYCYSLVLATIIISLQQHRKLVKFYRYPSKLLISGMVISVAFNILVLSDLVPVPVDLSLLGITICFFFLYFALRNNRGISFLIHARNEAFNDLEEAVLIVDDERTIINKNQLAVRWMEIAGLDPRETDFQLLMDQFRGITEKTLEAPDTDGGMDYCFDSSLNNKVINLRENPILDNGGHQIGSFVICADVTENRALINQLDRQSGLDALTGMGNRRKFDGAIADLDRPENLPLGMIVGDLNNLKDVNDNFGHHQGDVLLRLASEVIEFCCPPKARPARVGGDEFYILLPKTDAREAEALIRQIQDRLESIKNHPFQPSIAMGFAIKDDPDQNLRDILAVADKNMYAHKEARRAGA